MAHTNHIRPITQRLNTTSVEDLPPYAGFLAASISGCNDIFKGSEALKSEGSVQIHKLITRVTSLLQDKTQEGRFTGIVLVKALVEACGNQNLAQYGLTWVRALLSSLNKQDPPLVKRLVILVVARIFLLTKNDQAMVREITTPSLPAFMTGCLTLIKPVVVEKNKAEKQVQSSLLVPVLECWSQLMKAFPSTIRPFTPSIRAIVLSLLSQPATSGEVKQLAAEVFANLHFCATKDNVASEWLHSVQLIIETAHQTADLVFRSVVEEWASLTQRKPPSSTGTKLAAEVQSLVADPLGMDRWVSLQAGCARASELLKVLGVMLTSEHAQAIKVPLAEVLDVTGRFAAVLPPTKEYSLREQKEIGRDEREELFAHLPHMHCAVIQIHMKLADRFGRALCPVSRALLLQIWEIFDATSYDYQVRLSTYSALLESLRQGSIVLHPQDSERIANLVRKCCNDLKAMHLNSHQSSTESRSNLNGTLNGKLQPQSKTTTLSESPINKQKTSAWHFLPALLTHIPPSLLSSSTRAEIDRVAILLGHQEAMFASVLNPQLIRRGMSKTPSILPFLARNAASEMGLEALLRPRMPVIQDLLHSEMDVDVDDDDRSEDGDELPAEIESSYAKPNSEEEQPPAPLSVEELSQNRPAKKRDVASMDIGANDVPADSTKRARVDSAAKEADYDLASMPRYSMDTDGPHAVATDATAATAIRSEAVPSTSSALNDSKVVPIPLLETVAAATRTFTGVDDDSDDSEIPQIDATLSSDDDEDED